MPLEKSLFETEIQIKQHLEELNKELNKLELTDNILDEENPKDYESMSQLTQDQIKAIKQVAGTLKLELAQFRELQAFAQSVADLGELDEYEATEKQINVIQAFKNKLENIKYEIKNPGKVDEDTLYDLIWEKRNLSLMCNYNWMAIEERSKTENFLDRIAINNKNIAIKKQNYKKLQDEINDDKKKEQTNLRVKLISGHEADLINKHNDILDLISETNALVWLVNQISNYKKLEEEHEEEIKILKLVIKEWKREGKITDKKLVKDFSKTIDKKLEECEKHINVKKKNLQETSSSLISKINSFKNEIRNFIKEEINKWSLILNNLIEKQELELDLEILEKSVRALKEQHDKDICYLQKQQTDLEDERKRKEEEMEDFKEKNKELKESYDSNKEKLGNYTKKYEEDSKKSGFASCVSFIEVNRRKKFEKEKNIIKLQPEYDEYENSLERLKNQKLEIENKIENKKSEIEKKEAEFQEKQEKNNNKRLQLTQKNLTDVFSTEKINKVNNIIQKINAFIKNLVNLLDVWTNQVRINAVVQEEEPILGPLVPFDDSASVSHNSSESELPPYSGFSDVNDTLVRDDVNDNLNPYDKLNRMVAEEKAKEVAAAAANYQEDYCDFVR